MNPSSAEAGYWAVRERVNPEREITPTKSSNKVEVFGVVISGV